MFRWLNKAKIGREFKVSTLDYALDSSYEFHVYLLYNIKATIFPSMWCRLKFKATSSALPQALLLNHGNFSLSLFLSIDFIWTSELRKASAIDISRVSKRICILSIAIRNNLNPNPLKAEKMAKHGVLHVGCKLRMLVLKEKNYWRHGLINCWTQLHNTP